jgi:hypothetical protein
MGLSALISRIVDPRLSEFVACWDEARGERPAPHWRDLDIGGLKRVLANIWAWEYDRASDIWTGKLAGEEIMHVLGRGFRGAKAHEYFQGRQRDLIIGRHKRIVFDTMGMVNTGRVFWHAGSFAMGQRVALPVMTRGDVCDTVLGVTFYKFNAPVTKPIRAEAGDEEAEFFTLER